MTAPAIDFSELQGVDFEGFDPSEVKGITTDYVCAHCYGELVAHHVPNDRLYIVICPECGESVEKVGAVSRSTVSIRYESGRREYETVVRNLKDLYPTLQDTIKSKHTPLREGETEEERNIRELGF